MALVLIKNIYIYVLSFSQMHTEVEEPLDKQSEFPQDSPISKFRVQSPEKLFHCKHCDETFSSAEKLKVCLSLLFPFLKTKKKFWNSVFNTCEVKK